MTISDVLASARYIVDASGNKTEVVLPVQTWKKLLQTWERLADLLEDQEDQAAIRAWIAERASGSFECVSLDDLERELVNDGLLPG